MNGLQTTVCILLIVWLLLCIVNVCIQISIYWKQYKHAKQLEDSIKNFDNVMGETFKDIQRDKFFKDIEDLTEENKEDKGDKE